MGNVKGDVPAFELEMTPKAGEIPQATLDELVRLKEEARVAAKDYGLAIEAQAQRYRVRKAALRAYVAALHKDALYELSRVADDLCALIDERAKSA